MGMWSNLEFYGKNHRLYCKLSSESYIDRYRQDMGYNRSGPWGHPQSQELEMTNYLNKSLNPDP